jgi:hypothetical protein
MSVVAYAIKHMSDATSGGGFAFYLPDGARLSNSPPLPAGDQAAITQCHGAEITPTTTVPPHSGGRLDLNMAVWVAVTNAEVRARRRAVRAEPTCPPGRASRQG